jgi:hypothetical protein
MEEHHLEGESRREIAGLPERLDGRLLEVDRDQNYF